MAISMEFKAVGIEGLEKALKKFPNGKWYRRALRRGAFMTQEIAANQKIRHGARTSPPIPGILTDRHGGHGLVGSIAVDMPGGARHADIGSHLLYAKGHELGLGRFPRRAFLRPALEDVGPKLPGIFVQELEREFRR